MATWIPLAGLVVLLALAGAVWAITRPGRSGSPGLRAARTTRTLAVVCAGICTAMGVILAVTTLTMADVPVSVPVEQFWPGLPPGASIEGTTATLVGGGFHTADLVASHLSAGTRITLALSHLLTWLTPAMIAALVALACFQLIAGRAFAPVVARMATITAVTVLIGGIAAQVLGDVASSMAASEILSWSGASLPTADASLDSWWPKATLSIAVPFWPIAACIAFAALAAVLRYGSRLQRDTEGLV